MNILATCGANSPSHTAPVGGSFIPSPPNSPNSGLKRLHSDGRLEEVGEPIHRAEYASPRPATLGDVNLKQQQTHSVQLQVANAEPEREKSGWAGETARSKVNLLPAGDEN